MQLLFDQLTNHCYEARVGPNSLGADHVYPKVHRSLFGQEIEVIKHLGVVTNESQRYQTNISFDCG